MGHTSDYIALYVILCDLG